MPFADTHCHLDFAEFNEVRETLVRRCKQAGIEMLVVPGVQRENWNQCLSLSSTHALIQAAVGLHPYYISEHKESDLDALDRCIGENRLDIVGVGEIGLDDTHPEFDKQRYFFEAQLALAEKYQLPVIMHIRRNHGQGLKLVKKYELVGGVVHAFSGSSQDASAWIDLGMKIGVGGVITYERARKTQQAIAQLPLDGLVLETDSPDMAIQGFGKGEGSPMLVLDIFEALVRLRKESPDKVKNTLWHNSQALFGMNR